MSTRKSTLTADRLKEVVNYDPETGKFNWIKRRRGVILGAELTSMAQKGYMRATIDRSSYMLHRLAWLYVHGQFPALLIDHRNGIKHDNRIENLREVLPVVNSQNMRKAHMRSRSGLIGAATQGHLFRARIRVHGKVVQIGYFKTPEEAHAAYVSAKRRLHEGCTI